MTHPRPDLMLLDPAGDTSVIDPPSARARLREIKQQGHGRRSDFAAMRRYLEGPILKEIAALEPKAVARRDAWVLERQAARKKRAVMETNGHSNGTPPGERLDQLAHVRTEEAEAVLHTFLRARAPLVDRLRPTREALVQRGEKFAPRLQAIKAVIDKAKAYRLRGRAQDGTQISLKVEWASQALDGCQAALGNVAAIDRALGAMRRLTLLDVQTRAGLAKGLDQHHRSLIASPNDFDTALGKLEGYYAEIVAAVDRATPAMVEPVAPVPGLVPEERRPPQRERQVEHGRAAMSEPTLSPAPPAGDLDAKIDATREALVTGQKGSPQYNALMTEYEGLWQAKVGQAAPSPTTTAPSASPAAPPVSAPAMDLNARLDANRRAWLAAELNTAERNRLMAEREALLQEPAGQPAPSPSEEALAPADAEAPPGATVAVAELPGAGHDEHGAERSWDAGRVQPVLADLGSLDIAPAAQREVFERVSALPTLELDDTHPANIIPALQEFWGTDYEENMAAARWMARLLSPGTQDLLHTTRAGDDPVIVSRLAEEGTRRLNRLHALDQRRDLSVDDRVRELRAIYGRRLA